MPRKLIVFIIFSYIVLNETFSQKYADDYELPKVDEGSYLYLSSYPSISSYKENNDSSESTTRFSIDFNSHYLKWRFTPKTEYLLALRTGAFVSHEEDYWSAFTASAELAGNFYLGNAKVFAGSYLNGTFSAYKGDKPYSSAQFYPNIGYGRVVDAFVVNEVSNIETILSESSYITKTFDRKTRAGLNSLLDKRLSEFESKYKDNADIEFFSAVEKYLLDEGVIIKPLNARTTMKLYQLLTNNKFIYYPVLKGWHVMAELGLNHFSPKKDTTLYPVDLTLSGLYGIPLSNKTGLVFSTAATFPLNDYNTGDLEFNIHAPFFLRSNRSLNQLAAPRYSVFDNSYDDIFDYMISAQGFLFHTISPKFGVSGGLKFAIGKVKNLDFYHHRTEATITLLYSVLSKMGIESGIRFRNSNTYSYRFNFYSSIYYYIF